MDTDSVPRYPYHFEGARVVWAIAYPVKHLGDFRTHLHNVWVPQRAAACFRDRNPAVLPHLAAIVPSLIMDQTARRRRTKMPNEQITV